MGEYYCVKCKCIKSVKDKEVELQPDQYDDYNWACTECGSFVVVGLSEEFLNGFKR